MVGYSQSPNLRPTLWRTCRALANRDRLRIFVHLISANESSVTEVAEIFRLDLPIASIYLRALNARGLVAARRSGRFVLYRVAPNREVEGAEALVRALRRAFSDGQSVEQVFRALTAFTHPRRVALVHALESRGTMPPVQLRRVCRMSVRALRRHLAKLEDRGIITRDKNGVKLRRPDGLVARELVDLACSGD
jgi:DNA-binding transcriptional ArsR family regulator